MEGPDMDFRYSEAVTAFAGEVRTFLAAQLTEESRRQMHDSGTYVKLLDKGSDLLT